MPLLEMNVEAVRSVRGNISRTHDNLRQSADGLRSLMMNTVGKTWIAPGAEQFQTDFQAWLAHFNMLLQALDHDGQRLNEEVNKWEDVARSY